VTAITKLFLGEAHRVVLPGLEPAGGEDVPGDAGHVLLDQRLAPGEVEHAVRREQVLQLQPAHAGGVADLHVEVVVVLVVGVDDADAEGLRVAEGAEVDAVHVDVAEDLHAAFAAQQRVRLQQALREAVHLVARVGDRLPQRVLAPLEQRHGRGEVAQLRVGDRQRHLAALAREVGTERLADRVGRLAVRPLELGGGACGVHRQSRLGRAWVSSIVMRSGAPGSHSAR
jgi:hypothetical protein